MLGAPVRWPQAAVLRLRFSLRRLLPVAAFVYLLAAAIFPTHAAPPTLEYLHPAGGQQGTSLKVTAGGKFDPWPVQVWSDCVGLKFTPQEKKGEFQVEISSAAPAGPHLVRFYSDGGASTPRTFVIGVIPELAEQEPNDSLSQAHLIESLPVTLNGRLEKSGDVDSFALELPAGRWLVADVQAYSLGSPVDAVLHLYNPDGVRVAFNHDRHNLDPLLAWNLEQSGRYILQLAGFVHPPAADVRFAGGNSTVYRLTLTTNAFARHTFPLAFQRGQKTAVELIGWNLPDATKLPAQFDATKMTSDVEVLNWIQPPIQNSLRVPLVDHPAHLESGVNPEPASATPLALPCSISGRIDAAGGQDGFSFEAKKGDKFEFTLLTASLGSALYGLIRIEDSAGKQLARTESDGVTDAKLNWTTPADGTYRVTVADVTGNGGPDFIYRIDLRRALPDFSATVASHSLNVERGKTAELKFKLDRLHGHTAPLKIELENLPAEVTAAIGEVPAKSGEVKITLTASPDANSAQQTFRILVRPESESEPHRRARFTFLNDASRGDLLINETDQLWLTVISKPEAKAAEAEAQPRE